jgi:hypothetical protein
MVSEIRIYYEGDRKLKEGFRTFFAALFDAARRLRCRMSLIAGHATPVEDFKDALDTRPAAWNILLKDSEGPDNGHLFSTLSLDRSLLRCTATRRSRKSPRRMSTSVSRTPPEPPARGPTTKLGTLLGCCD